MTIFTFSESGKKDMKGQVPFDLLMVESVFGFIHGDNNNNQFLINCSYVELNSEGEMYDLLRNRDQVYEN